MSDRIVTHPTNEAYRNGYDAIFGKQEGAQGAHGEPVSDDQKQAEHMYMVGAGKICRT